MKTAIIYASETPQNDSWEISKRAPGGKFYRIHVRVQITNKPPEEAITSANPRKCETVLNAIEINQ